MSKNLACTSRVKWNAATVIVLELALAAAASGQITGEWSTFMDGTRQTAIAAEGDARVWVASTGGATGFAPDDSTYVRLSRNDGLPSQDLTSVAVDARGYRWFGSRGRGLQAETPDGRFLRRPLDRFDLGSDSVRVLLAAGEGEGAWGDSTVWVGTESGAALVTYPPNPNRPDSAVLLTFNIRSLLGERPLVNAIAVRDSTAWFGTERGVVRLTTSGARAIVNDGLTDLDVRALTVFEDSLWAGTASRVFRFEGGQWVERASGLTVGQPFLSFATFEGALHAGAAASPTPVYRLDGLAWSPRASGIGNFNVAGLAAARGSLWAATSRAGNLQGGLFVLGANDTWRRIPSPDPPGPGFGDFDAAYLDVAAVPGTGEGRAITRFFIVGLDESGWSSVGVGQQSIENTQLSQVLADAEGRNWLAHCCCGTGITCRSDRLDDLAGDALALGAYDIIDLTSAPSGDIWLASVRSGDVSPGFGLYRISGASSTVTRFVGSATFPLRSRSLEALTFDQAGQLWIGHTQDGVDIWTSAGDTTAALIHLDLAQGLPSLRVTAMATAGEDVWVGTVTGIAIYSGTLLERVIRGDALPDPQVRDLAFDGCGRAWVATDAGVVVFDGDGTKLGEFTDDPATWPGVADGRVNGIDVDRTTGTIWFATQNGLSRFAYDLSCGSATGGGVACTRLCPFPNPYDPAFDPGLRITGITALGPARVTVFDAIGSQVARGEASPDGTVWDGRDGDGTPVPFGVYLVKIEGGGEVVMRRVAVRR
jgi:ligand-binding sensor domain-containing protein